MTGGAGDCGPRSGRRMGAEPAVGQALTATVSAAKQAPSRIRTPGRELPGKGHNETTGNARRLRGLSDAEAKTEMTVVADPTRQPPSATPVVAFTGAAAGMATIMVAGAALVTGTWWRAAPAPFGGGATLTDAGRLTGLLAGYVALLQVMLRIRLPVIERRQGTDSINEMHRLLGGYLIVLIVSHATLITAGYAIAARSSVPQGTNDADRLISLHLVGGDRCFPADRHRHFQPPSHPAPTALRGVAQPASSGVRSAGASVLPPGRRW